MKTHKSYIRFAKYSPLILAIISLPLNILILMYLSFGNYNQILFGTLFTIYLISLIMYSSFFYLNRDKLNNTLIVNFSIIFVLLKFLFGFNDELPVISDFSIQLFLFGELAFLLLSLSFIINNSKHKILKSSGVVGALSAAVTLFFFVTGLTYSDEQLPLFINLLMLFSMLLIVILPSIFFILQFVFFKKLLKEKK